MRPCKNIALLVATIYCWRELPCHAKLFTGVPHIVKRVTPSLVVMMTLLAGVLMFAAVTLMLIPVGLTNLLPHNHKYGDI